MMGHAHATTGAAAWVALGSSSVLPLNGTEILVGAVVAAGAALLPDLDHRSGTIAHALPPISGLAATAVERISGGHRHGTHSLVGVLVVFGVAWIAAAIRIDIAALDGTFQVGAWVLVVLLVAIALKSLKISRGWGSSWGLAIGLGTMLTWHAPINMWWLPVCVGVGALVHVLGDALTVQGVPLLWPLRPAPAVESPMWKRNGHFALPVLGKAGSAREWVLVGVVNAYLVWVIAAAGLPVARSYLEAGAAP